MFYKFKKLKTNKDSEIKYQSYNKINDCKHDKFPLWLTSLYNNFNSIRV